MLIHGSLVTADDMVIALSERLSKCYDVLAFDRPGHGGSDQNPTNQGSPYAQAAMLEAGWTRLGVDRPILVGHSFGGAVALSEAISAPEAIAGVIAVAPICFPEARLEHMLLGPRAAPAIGGMIAHMYGPMIDVAALPLLRNAMFFPQIMPSAYSERFPFAWASGSEMMISDAKDSIGMLRALPESAASYARCRVMTHVLGGTHDMVVSNAQHGFAAAALMPNATFEWAAGCGHMIHHFRIDLIMERLASMIDGR